jgi:hypothetical protein
MILWGIMVVKELIEMLQMAGGDAGDPFAKFKCLQPRHPFIWRNVNSGKPGKPQIDDDNEIISKESFKGFRRSLEKAHNAIHNYIGGGIEDPHYSFTDPFVIILHSNVDRLWAKWQTDPDKKCRLDPDSIYGEDSDSPALKGNIQPWGGNYDPIDLRLRPWVPPDNWKEQKTYKDESIVKNPPL